ncbi:MAG TPA: lipase secretion chaperone [Xanthomonadales bacterium]|nr:lipase secretion chaperone [Xanthomonadales bacterium]
MRGAPHSMRLLALAALLLAAVCLIAGLRTQPVQATIAVAPRALPSPVPVTSPPAQRAGTAAGVALVDDVLASTSLRGSEVDGALRFADGRLLPDRELRRLFDWWLALDGELAPAAIRAALAQWLATRFGGVDAQRVLDLFDRYVRCRAAIAGVDPALPLERRLPRLHALRVEWLGREVAEAFFGDEEREAALALERRRVVEDPLLTRDERAARIAVLDAALPETERAARDAELEPWLVDAQTTELATSGASSAQRLHDRRALWGEAAARRLAALDAERAAWDERVAHYVRERDVLLAATPAGAQQAALDELRARRFAPHEARRIASLEAIDALP